MTAGFPMKGSGDGLWHVRVLKSGKPISYYTASVFASPCIGSITHDMNAVTGGQRSGGRSPIAPGITFSVSLENRRFKSLPSLFGYINEACEGPERWEKTQAVIQRGDAFFIGVGNFYEKMEEFAKKDGSNKLAGWSEGDFDNYWKDHKPIIQAATQMRSMKNGATKGIYAAWGGEIGRYYDSLNQSGKFLRAVRSAGLGTPKPWIYMGPILVLGHGLLF